MEWLSHYMKDWFDVRGYLNDLKQYENYKNITEELTPQELQFERLCDEERFADLKNEEDMNHEEEEIKRFHAALADGKDYNQMDYKYDDNSINANDSVIKSSPQKEENELIEDNDRFKLPSGLTPPENIILPESQKLHNIIEKTASFVSKHGIQMEIIVKTKQSSNKNFDFLSFDSKLNPYYRFVLSSIKSGKYIPKETENSDKSDSDDSDDDNYLHPSLLGSNKSGDKHSNEPFNIPNLLRGTNNHDSYSQLVKSFRDNFPNNNEEILETTKPLFEEKLTIVKSDSHLNDSNNGVENCVAIATQPLWSSLLPSPPPEIEVIIEKLAQHVAKNGEQFELSIRKLGEKRFEFVNPGNIYHAYYIRRKLHHLEENRKVQAIQLKMNHKKNVSRSDSHTTKAPVSFSISAKDSKSQMGTSDESVLITAKRDDERNSKSEINAKRICENALKDKLAYAARDRIAKEKQLQEERKRKAALFLSLIKKQNKEQPKKLNSNDTNSEQSSAYGPELPKSKPNDCQQLSPTIVAVTSPDNSPDIHKYNDNESLLLDNALSLRSFETTKSGSLLPFIVSDKPLKESSSRLSPPHRHHSHKKSYKRKRSPKQKSRHSSKSRSPSSRSSHKKRSKDSSKSRSRSRSRSHSRSHKRN